MTIEYIKRTTLPTFCRTSSPISVVMQIHLSEADTPQAVFRDKDQKFKTGSMPYMNLVSPKRFDVLLKVILTLIASVLLLAPVFILFKIQPTKPSQVQDRSRSQMAVVFLFTLTFSACCTIFTKARKQEIFTATAAYSAVLVVFLGNTSNIVACPSNG